LTILFPYCLKRPGDIRETKVQLKERSSVDIVFSQ
jgi:hypothetical protein